MKILSVEQMRSADEYTILHEPIASIDLMERAGQQCCIWIKENISKEKCIKVFCGLGNNGGDGLVIARLLQQDGYSVNVYIINYSQVISPDCRRNYDRYIELANTCLFDIFEGEELPAIDSNDVIIDALLGTGTNKATTGFLSVIINHINQSGAQVISIDMPSGLFADKSNAETDGAVVHAHTTLTLQLPKLSMFFPENAINSGKWVIIPIGLSKTFIDSSIALNKIISLNMCKHTVKTRNKFGHKGMYGHALLLSGSYGKIGASVLASKATLRIGAGLLTAHIPLCGYNTLQTAVPEAMVETDYNNGIITVIPDTSNYAAIAIGPGIGKAQETQYALRTLIEQYHKPIVIDADGLNILSYNKDWLYELPAESILTPHIKEFERLAGRATNDFNRNDMQRELSKKHNVYIVLKGAHTAITCPDGTCYFNSTGNPGMATAGTGDVLTGILLGLLAQGYTPKETCILGTFIHGLAGDLALDNQSQNSLIASDIITNLGKAYKIIETPVE